MTRKIGLLALIVAGLGGCLFEDNPDRCTEDRDGRKCDLTKQTWEATPAVPDMTVLCTSSADCKDASLPICGNNGRCVACNASAATPDGGVSECAAGHPSEPICLAGACVQCLTSTDCISKKKACDKATHACVPCAKNADCAGGVCESGSCRTPADVVYVDGKNCKMGATGTFTDPLCLVQEGLNKGATSGKPVVVRAGTYQEDLSVDGKTADFIVNVIADGAVSLQPKSMSQPAVSIKNDGSHQVTLSFDGFTIEKGDKANGVKCTGAMPPGKTVVTFTRTSITGNSAYGVGATNCTVNLSQCRLGPDNKLGGMQIQGDGMLVNSLILRNGSNTSAAGGVVIISQTNRIVVANNTFVGNQSIVDASGLNCMALGPTTFNNAFIENTGTTEEVSVACMADHSAFAGALALGTNVDLTNCKPEDLFKAPTNNDYHLVKGTPTCSLVDKGAANFGGEQAPATDHDGNPRPANSKFDIGAYELQ